MKDTLIKVRELLSDESRWTQGTYARDADGTTVPFSDPDAAKWCLLGGIFKTAPSVEEAEYVIKRVESHIDTAIAKFNDRATHRQVMEFLDKVIEGCKE